MYVCISLSNIYIYIYMNTHNILWLVPYFRDECLFTDTGIVMWYAAMWLKASHDCHLRHDSLE